MNISSQAMHELFQSHVPNAHTLSYQMASHSYVNISYKSPVASRQRLAFFNVLRITYNLPHNHTRLRNFNNPFPPTTGIPSLSFPNCGNINNTIPCPKPMLCVVADSAIMSTSHEHTMPNVMSFNVNALKCILYNMAFLYSIEQAYSIH